MVTESPSASFRVLDLVIDPAAGTVTRHGQRVPLPPRTFDLLLALARHAPGVVRRHDLIDTVWPDEHVTEQTLSRRVFLLRHALGDEAEHPRYVAGERGWGYRLVPPVEVLPPAPRWRRSARWRLGAGATAVALAAMVVVALSRPWRGAGAGVTSPKVVRASAFTASPADPDLEWLADHLTRATRDRLRGVGGLRTVAGDTPDPPDLALSGAVERRVEGLRVSLLLEDGRSRRVAWSRSVTGSAHDLLSDQSGVAAAASEAVARELGLPAPSAAGDTTPEAERLCLRGLYLWGTWTRESLYQSLEAFERAGGIAPHLGLPAAGEALAHATLALQGEAAPQEHLAGARDAVTRAVRLAPDLPLAQTALGLVRLVADDDAPAAEAAARRAVAAEPADPAALVGLALVLQARGRHAESLPLLQQAGRGDPFWACIPLLIGRSLLAGGRAREAAAAFERAVALSASLPAARHGLAEARAALGSEHEALAAELAEWRLEEVSPAEQIAVERAFTAGGLAGLRRHACRSHELERRVPADVVRACVAAGETARAVALLERAAEERWPCLRLLLQEPALEPLRRDGRVRALLARPAPSPSSATPSSGSPPPSARRPGSPPGSASGSRP